jgi:archaellum component FlaF (FlaF/FlaG flagellin family)
MATTLTAIALDFNGSTAITAVNCTTNGEGVEVSMDSFDRLILMGYNSDTNAATVAIAASDQSDMIRKGITALSTSIGSSAFVFFGPFDSQQYKSSSDTLVVNTTSSGSTNIDWYAFYAPKAKAE